ncbi:MAG TPA: hypothetical protein VJ835_01770 [Fimbriimonadaceae bacterium]|nr:hypothetical protein [Fimbriimonadaceae bacterium]
MKSYRVIICIGSVVGIAALAWGAQIVRTSINGKAVPGRMIGGSVYVKLSDVAKALNQNVSTQSGTYVVAPAGGANMIQGTKGKKGEELFTGKWKFTVTDVQRVGKYMLRFADSKFELTAESGQDLVVVTCRFKNAVNKSVNMYFNGLQNTSLTDMSEQSYKPKWMDVSGGVASVMLPGSAKEFAIVFSVPEGAEEKDLVYTVEPVSSEFGVVDLRISLK